MGAHNLTRNSVLAHRVEVADTLWTRFMGLMARPSIDHGFGLWLTGTNGTSIVKHVDTFARQSQQGPARSALGAVSIPSASA